jgi:hypothetical protein
MTITQISAWIMLVSCGLWAGGILIFAVERTNLWRRMPIDQYAVDFRRSLFRVDPMMPILGVIAGAAATIFALQRSGAARGLAWAGLGFIVLVVVASVTIAEPINSKFRRLPEGQVPQRAEHYRTLWRHFHAVRNFVALAALACLAAAAVVYSIGVPDAVPHLRFRSRLCARPTPACPAYGGSTVQVAIFDGQTVLPLSLAPLSNPETVRALRTPRHRHHPPEIRNSKTEQLRRNRNGQIGHETCDVVHEFATGRVSRAQENSRTAPIGERN